MITKSKALAIGGKNNGKSDGFFSYEAQHRGGWSYGLRGTTRGSKNKVKRKSRKRQLPLDPGLGLLLNISIHSAQKYRDVFLSRPYPHEIT